MKHSTTTALVLLASLAVFQGCQRKAPTDGRQAADAGPSKTTAESRIEMVLIPAGRFTMGDKDEIDAPPHEVAVSSFYMDKYLVTQEHYQRLMGDNPARWKADRNPVEQVRWSDAVKFCNARSRDEGLEPCYDLETWRCNFDANGYRLPTEAQWEYACRAGTTTPFHTGETISSDQANYDARYAYGYAQEGGCRRKTLAVGSFNPNDFGLYDMHGNVWEWCADWYDPNYYKNAPTKNPTGPSKEVEFKTTAEGDVVTGARVLRGGSWSYVKDVYFRCARRNSSDPTKRYSYYGFCCARTT